ncbi:MAG: SDR family oxidoreductase [Phenylobacterium sp.]
MTSNLNGKTVVIVGGSIGIGLAVGKEAQAQGARVILVSSTQSKLDGAVAELGGSGRGLVLDVTDESTLPAFFQKVGPFDHLVFTAGDTAPPASTIADLDLKAAEGVFKLRFWGALAAIKHALPTLAGDGSIILTDGVVAHRPVKGRAVSSAMLGAVEHLVRSLAVDLAPIRVNGVCPGLIWGERAKSFAPEQLEARFARLPLHRAGEPAECAEAYLYLMRGGYTTGQVLTVDGGSSLS